MSSLEIFIIIGGIFLVLIIIAAVILVGFFIWKRRSEKDKDNGSTLISIQSVKDTDKIWWLQNFHGILQDLGLGSASSRLPCDSVSFSHQDTTVNNKPLDNAIFIKSGDTTFYICADIPLDITTAESLAKFPGIQEKNCSWSFDSGAKTLCLSKDKSICAKASGSAIIADKLPSQVTSDFQWNIINPSTVCG